jgi:hypothetical protein
LRSWRRRRERNHITCLHRLEQLTMMKEKRMSCVALTFFLPCRCDLRHSRHVDSRLHHHNEGSNPYSFVPVLRSAASRRMEPIRFRYVMVIHCHSYCLPLMNIPLFERREQVYGWAATAAQYPTTKNDRHRSKKQDAGSPESLQSQPHSSWLLDTPPADG